MKRAPFAAAALLLAAATSAHADQQTDVSTAFTAFRQNAIEMGLKGDMAGIKTLYETTIDADFKGEHNITLSLQPAAGDTDIGAMSGKPGALVISSPIIAFNFSVNTTKDGYVQMINGLKGLSENKSNADAQIALPALLSSTTLTAAVQSVEIGADGTTATVNNTLSGAIDGNKALKELGYPGLPPMLAALDLTVKMDCVTTLKLDDKGGFTVTGEVCGGGLEGVAKPNLPVPAPVTTPAPAPAPAP